MANSEETLDDEHVLTVKNNLDVKPLTNHARDEEVQEEVVPYSVVEVEPLNRTSDLVAMQIKVYPRRWLVLFLFVLFGAANNMQWVQYTIIENIVARYYDVSSLAVEWTALIFNALYAVLLVPSSYMFYKIDMRNTCIIAAVSTCVASWIKVFSVSPDRFAVTFIGQVILGCWQIVVMATPSSLAAYWFGPEQVATATAIGTFGMTFGIAFFSFVTPMIVRNHESLDDIGHDLYVLSLGVAIFCTAVAVMMIGFFRNEPVFPPSKSRALQKLHKVEQFDFWRPICRILKNKNFILLWMAHGLNVGLMSGIITILNPLYLAHFENGEEDAGRIALVIIIFGMLGCTVFGRIQDKTKKFKELMIFLYLCSLLGVLLFTISLNFQAKWAVYLTSAFMGFFMLSYMTTGYETCAEITYPESEGICMAVLNMANQIDGVIVVVIANKIMESYGQIAAHGFLCFVLVIGLILTIITGDEQNRQAAIRNTS